jgi:hypothetical protein
VHLVRNERRSLARHAAEVWEHFHSSIEFDDGFDTSQLRLRQIHADVP